MKGFFFQNMYSSLNDWILKEKAKNFAVLSNFLRTIQLQNYAPILTEIVKSLIHKLQQTAARV